MMTTTRSFALSCALFVASLGPAGCGGDDDDDGGGAGPGCTGTQLSESQLCQLKCSESTEAQTQAALGAPSASTNGLLRYQYTCVDVALGSAESISWDFFFTNGALSNVTRTGTGSYAGGSVPSCLSACAQ